MAAEMHCDRAQVLISKQLDDECSAAESLDLRRHVDSCASCRQLAADFGLVSGLLDRVQTVPVPADFVQRVMAALPAELLHRPSRTLRFAEFALGIAAFVGGLSLSAALENGTDAASSQNGARETAARPADLGDMMRPEALDGDLILAMTGSEEQPWQR